MYKRKDKRQLKRYKPKSTRYFVVKKPKCIVQPSRATPVRASVTIPLLSKRDLGNGMRSLSLPKSALCSGVTIVAPSIKELSSTVFELRLVSQGARRSATQTVPMPVLKNMPGQIQVSPGTGKIVETESGKVVSKTTLPETIDKLPSFIAAYRSKWHLHLSLDNLATQIRQDDQWSIELRVTSVYTVTVVSGIRIYMVKALQVMLEDQTRIYKSLTAHDDSTRRYYINNYFNFRHEFKRSALPAYSVTSSGTVSSEMNKSFDVVGRMPSYRKIKPQDLYVSWTLSNISSEGPHRSDEPRLVSLRITIEKKPFYNFQQYLHPSVPYDYKQVSEKISNATVCSPSTTAKLQNIPPKPYSFNMTIECDIPETFVLSLNVGLKCVLTALGDDFPKGSRMGNDTARVGM